MKVLLSDSLVNLGYAMLTGSGILPDDTLLICFNDDREEVQIVNPAGDVLKSEKYPRPMSQTKNAATFPDDSRPDKKVTLNEYLVSLGHALLADAADLKTEPLLVCFDDDMEEVQIVNAAGDVLLSEKYPWEVTG
jgi:hypothetical protein